MTCEMFSEEKLSQAGQKQKHGIEPFFSNTFYGLKYEKTESVNYLLKCSLKNQSCKGLWTYQMLLSIKMLVYSLIKIFLTSHWTTLSIMKQPSSDITQFFAGHCPMSGATIQVWMLGFMERDFICYNIFLYLSLGLPHNQLRTYSRNLGQCLILAGKNTFLWKKISQTPLVQSIF